MLLFSAIRGGNIATSITAPTLGTPTMTSTTASITFSGGSGYTTLIPQYSTDNSTWTSLSSDTSSPIDVTSLTSSTLYYFRALADNNVSYASNTVTGTTSSADVYTITPQAGDYYVGPSGSDSNDGLSTSALRAGNPISTATYALAETNGKNIWCYGAGTYTLSNINFGPATGRVWIAPHPDTGRSAVLDCSTIVEVVGNNCRNVGIQGFTIDYDEIAFSVGTTPPGSDNKGVCRNFWIYDCVTTGATTHVDNDGFVYLATTDYGAGTLCTGTRIVKNVITGSFGTGGTNNAGIIVFGAEDLLCEGNIISGFDNPFYFKHTHSKGAAAAGNIILRNEYWYNASTGSRGVMIEGDYTECHNCLAVNVDVNVGLGGDAGSSGIGVKFYNCTVRGTGCSIVISVGSDSGSGEGILCEVHDCIVGNGTMEVRRYDAAHDPQYTGEGNLHTSSTMYYQGSSVNLSSSPSYETGIVSYGTAPTYVGSAAGTKTDHALHSTSVGYGSGVGVNTSTVGTVTG